MRALRCYVQVSGKGRGADLMPRFFENGQKNESFGMLGRIKFSKTLDVASIFDETGILARYAFPPSFRQLVLVWGVGRR